MTFSMKLVGFKTATDMYRIKDEYVKKGYNILGWGYNKRYKHYFEASEGKTFRI